MGRQLHSQKIASRGAEPFSDFSGARSSSDGAAAASAEAERWLFGKQDGWIFSFENICHRLGVDPGVIRAQLQERRFHGQADKASSRDPQVLPRRTASLGS